MIGKLQALIRDLKGQLDNRGQGPDPERVPLAIAALLVEAARADDHVKEVELEELGSLIAVRLELGPDEAQALVHRAREAVERSVSLYEFTRPLQETFTYEQKQEFIRMLWHVVLADRRLDKYEDYLVGKVADLLYVARGDVIRLRNAVMDEKPAGTGD